MNSGIIGSHYFSETNWTDVFIKKINDRAKSVGTSIVSLPESNRAGGYGPKVEGFFFMVDRVGFKKTYFAIIKGEFGLSYCILKNGFFNRLYVA